ncbi:serine/threonine-protein kinase [Myceligenerans pegani]|uniref:non-specific serine/threonine protein kinase n=1 Tax=Myceligenerans pegani TaxID=2776917 RepID=A0ABR9N1Z7_9MICO|nr:serine/threonine-protein kinase [Myceligenerans sp. TRM 65318]MBE1877669.1 serine/threonine protein kinase [Myceligenerans sp. TRM 65318]MBE3019940.1 serine/threonine protein kinase [Myceligenerans sp. TRM 65318]
MESGQTIAGQFRLEERLGRGGQGEVWKAVELHLERHVALKLAPGPEPGAARGLLREARKLARVNHPNVVTVHRTVAEKDADGNVTRIWLVMEYVPGRTLADLGRLPVRDVARYGAQLAGGLASVHEAGVLHQDIKPSNVLVTDDGVAKLADFGVARDLHGLTTLSGDARLIGTPGYLSPEAAETADVNEASDVFSLGATLYHALEGTSPYGTGDERTLLHRTQTQPVHPLTRGGEIAPLVRRMLSTSPRGRPTLERIRGDLAAVAGEPRAGLGDAVRRGVTGRRRSVLLAAAAVAAVGALVFGLWRMLGPSSDTGIPPGAALTPAPSSPAQAAGQPGAVGDEATADPCALLDVDTLASFGEARLDTDRRELNRCDVSITEPSGAELFVELKMWRSSSRLDGAGEAEQHGVVGVVRAAPDPSGFCERDLLLPTGDHVVAVDATSEAEVNDLCAVADSAVETAVARLNAGEIPRRLFTPEPGALLSQNACHLGEDAAVDAFLDGRPLEDRVVGFAAWDCRWDNAAGEELRVLFQHHEPLGDHDGRRITLGGYDAYVGEDSWGRDTCIVSVVAAERPDADGGASTTADLVRVVIEGTGDKPLETLCNETTAAARAVAEALPG